MFQTIATQSGSNGKEPGKNLSWVLDTGASYHMTGNHTLLHNLVLIPPFSVKLPDSRFVIAHQEGSLVISPLAKINHVLYIPTLDCNLISSAQLASDANYLVMLTKRLCVIQEPISRTVIGVGEQRGGVYWLGMIGDTGQVCHTSASSTSTLIWNQRLGHPSPTVLTSLSFYPSSGNKSYSHEPCDVCFKSKQTRSHFPISQNKATSLFQLIHCDVWGPYSVPSTTGASYFFLLFLMITLVQPGFT